VLFLVFGWGKLTDYSWAVAYMTQSGAPLPSVAALVAIVIEFFGGIALGLPKDEASFFADWGWIASPAAKKGGQAGSLTHPIIYAVAAHAKDPELAVRVLGHASDADLNTDHAVTTTHLGIKPEQLKDPRYAAAWPLARATELLKITKFLPNNPQFGDLNGIIYTGLQGVETGRLSAAQAADFVIDEAGASLRDVFVR